MSSCNSSPTLTRTDQVVTGSLSTSTTSHVTTLPPSTTTITLTPSCTATSGCNTSPVVTVSEIPGGTSTVVDTVTFTVPITSSHVTTLWGGSCSPTNPNTPPTPTPTITSFSTPPPSIFVTSSSSTQADGNVTPVVFTITSTVPPVLVSPTASDGDVHRNSDSSKHLGPIIGGVVGGVVGLCAILFLVWFFIRRRRRWDDIFDNDDDVPAVIAAANQKEKQAEAKAKPYHYGLVGHTESPSITSPPSSPPRSAAPTLLDGTHYRNNSTTPLLGPPMRAAAPGTGTSPSPRPPSSTSSALGYGYQVDTNAQAQIWDPSRLYNAPMQPQTPFSGPPAGPVGPIAAMVGRSDPDHRTGSPVSFQEQRILQVTNADMNPQGAQTPRVGTPVLISGPSPDPWRDGKGRVARGEKASIVHLDGGRYQEPVAGSSSASAPAPPAYSA